MGNDGMAKVDLITGFLGAGKTTYIARYAAYLRAGGQRFAVIENEFGAAGVDAALLREDGVDVEELAGGCICCALKVHFHDALLALAKRCGRILVEPSGIFNPGDFFEVMASPAVRRVCEMGCMVAVTDPALPDVLSPADRAVMAGELLHAGRIVVSKTEDLGGCLPRLLEDLKKLAPGMREDKIYPVPLPLLSRQDFRILEQAGPAVGDTAATADHSALFQSCTFYPEGMFARGQIWQIFDELPACGEVSRVKGCLSGPQGGWFINYTMGGRSAVPVARREKPMVNVIGRNLNRRALKALFAG
jgi:G3E family GTPase